MSLISTNNRKTNQKYISIVVFPIDITTSNGKIIFVIGFQTKNLDSLSFFIESISWSRVIRSP